MGRPVVIRNMLIVTALCVAGVVCVVLLGEENLLILFGGDLDLATRATHAMMAAFTFLGFAFAQPAIWRAFITRARKVIARGGSGSPLARAILRPDTPGRVEKAGMVLCAVFTLAAFVIVRDVWSGGFRGP